MLIAKYHWATVAVDSRTTGNHSFTCNKPPESTTISPKSPQDSPSTTKDQYCARLNHSCPSLYHPDFSLDSLWWIKTPLVITGAQNSLWTSRNHHVQVRWAPSFPIIECCHIHTNRDAKGKLSTNKNSSVGLIQRSCCRQIKSRILPVTFNKSDDIIALKHRTNTGTLVLLPALCFKLKGTRWSLGQIKAKRVKAWGRLIGLIGEKMVWSSYIFC